MQCGLMGKKFLKLRERGVLFGAVGGEGGIAFNKHDTSDLKRFRDWGEHLKNRGKKTKGFFLAKERGVRACPRLTHTKSN